MSMLGNGRPMIVIEQKKPGKVVQAEEQLKQPEQEITGLRTCVVRIHEYLESCAESGLIPMFVFSDITKMIEKAEERE